MPSVIQESWHPYKKVRLKIGQTGIPPVLHMFISLGLSLFWLGVWLFLQNRLFAPLAGGSPITSLLTPLFGYAAGFFGLGILYQKKRIEPQGSTHLILALALELIGLLLSISTSLNIFSLTQANGMASFIGNIFIGVGIAFFHVEWGRVLGHLGSFVTIIHTCIASILAAALYLVLSFFPLNSIIFIAALLASIQMIILSKTYRAIPALGANSKRDEPTEKLYVPWRFLITGFTQGVVYGIAQTLFFIAGPANTQITVSISLATLLGALLVFVLSNLFQLNFNNLIYRVGFPLMALGLLIRLMLPAEYIAGTVTDVVAFRFTDIVIWAFCAYMISEKKISANWVFTISTGTLIVGEMVGTIAGNATLVSGPAGSSVHALIALAMFTLLTAAIYLHDTSGNKSIWGSLRPGEHPRTTVASAEIYNHIQHEYQLTPRERDVFELLSVGYNRTAISEKLVLSENTIKTHIKNIYSKLGISSKQEIVDLFQKEIQLHTTKGSES